MSPDHDVAKTVRIAVCRHAVRAVAALVALIVGLLCAAPATAADGNGKPENYVKYYVVPRTGAEVTLASIAAETLSGNVERYVEILDLNEDRIQRDGERLTSPRIVKPGWVLLLPEDASGPAVWWGPLPGVQPTPPRDGGNVAVPGVAAPLRPSAPAPGGFVSPMLLTLLIGGVVAVAATSITVARMTQSGPGRHRYRFGARRHRPDREPVVARYRVPARAPHRPRAQSERVSHPTAPQPDSVARIRPGRRVMSRQTAEAKLRPADGPLDGASPSFQPAASTVAPVDVAPVKVAPVDVGPVDVRQVDQPAVDEVPMQEPLAQEPDVVPPAPPGPMTASLPTGRRTLDLTLDEPVSPAAAQPKMPAVSAGNTRGVGEAPLINVAKPTAVGNADPESADAPDQPAPGTFRLSFGGDTVDVHLDDASPGGVVAWSDKPYDAPDRDGTYVCIGAAGDEFLFLDLTKAPGTVAVCGSEHGARRLAEAITQQLATGAEADRTSLILVGDVHQSSADLAGAERVPSLAHLVARPPAEPAEDGPALTVVVCSRDGAKNRTALSWLLADKSRRIVPFVIGDVPNAAWSLVVYRDDDPDSADAAAALAQSRDNM